MKPVTPDLFTGIDVELPFMYPLHIPLGRPSQRPRSVPILVSASQGNVEHNFQKAESYYASLSATPCG